MTKPLDDLDPRDRRLALATIAPLLAVLLFFEPGPTHAILVAAGVAWGALLMGLLARSRELRWLMLVGLLPTVLIVVAAVDQVIPFWALFPSLLVCGAFAQREPGDTITRWAVRFVAALTSAGVGGALAFGAQSVVAFNPWVVAPLALLTLGLLALLSRDERRTPVEPAA